MLMVNLLLFGISSLGYWEFFRKKCLVGIYFLPLVTVAVQSCVLILGGIAGLLAPAAWTLYLLGFLLLGWALWLEKGRNWKAYLSWGFVFFLLGLFLTAMYLRGKVFTHNDNFTHWAIVVKKLLTADRFPNITDTDIGFPYYPLGSSVYIYYFCKMVGAAEPLQMLAQSYMMLAAFLPLFSCARRNAAAAGLALVGLVVMIFGYSIRINELLVDTLLPLVGMAAVLYVLVVFSEENISSEKKKYALWMLIPVLIWLSQIKNSGLLFSYAAIALLFLYPRWCPELLNCKLAAAAGPLLANLIWSGHCSAVFPQELQEKHALTIGNYTQTFMEKTGDNMLWIAWKTIRYMLTREGLFWILVWVVVLGVLTWLLHRAGKKGFFRLLAGLAGMHLIYMAGMVGMYLFSMPIEEAMTLASIERYSRSLDISAYYLIMAYSFGLISRTKKTAGCALICTCLIGMSFVTLKKIPDSRPWMTLDHRIRVEHNIAQYDIRHNCSYFICIPEYDAHHYYKLIHNYLLGQMPQAQRITDAAQLEEARGYDYLINMDPDNPIIREWIGENYPDRADAAVIAQP